VIYSKYTKINTGNVTVPDDFLGLQWFGFPENGVPNTPFQSDVRYKVTYNNDWDVWGNSPSNWKNVETAPGVYDWTALDKFMDGQAANGINICYSQLYMPSFWSANPLVAGPSGGLGDGGPLTEAGLTGLYNYVTAVINRYIARGTPIKYWQAWEEPQWPSSPGDGYWWGSEGDMVDLAHVTYLAVRAADPTITIIGISASDGPSAWIDYTGTVYTDIHGYDTYDYYGGDLFGYFSKNFPVGFDVTSSLYKSQLNNVSQPGNVDIGKIIATYNTQQGVHVKPLHITSYGFSYIGDGTVAAHINAQSADYRKKYIARILLQCAALGVKGVIVYGGDAWTYINNGNTQNWAGDFVNDTDGVIAGFNEIADYVVGKTIIFCGYLSDGSMTAYFSDGSTYTI
jgi:hypothetical protein